MGKRCSHLFGN